MGNAINVNTLTSDLWDYTPTPAQLLANNLSTVIFHHYFSVFSPDLFRKPGPSENGLPQ